MPVSNCNTVQSGHGKDVLSEPFKNTIHGARTQAEDQELRRAAKAARIQSNPGVGEDSQQQREPRQSGYREVGGQD